jgi:hypothetical protein
VEIVDGCLVSGVAEPILVGGDTKEAYGAVVGIY